MCPQVRHLYLVTGLLCYSLLLLLSLLMVLVAGLQCRACWKEAKRVETDTYHIQYVKHCDNLFTEKQ